MAGGGRGGRHRRPAPESSPPRAIDEATIETLFADRIESGALGGIRSGDRRGARLAGAAAGRDPAFGRAGQPRRSRGDRRRFGRRRPRPRPRPAALERSGELAAPAGRLRRATTIHRCPIFPTRRCSARSTSGCPCWWRASAGSTRSIRPPCGSAGFAARLGGPQAARPAGPRRVRDPGREQPRDRLSRPRRGPTVTVRVQALFGLSEHPAVAGGRVPLVLSLTSPAGRPIQTTRDLPGFWRGSWAAVAKEMRGRYPQASLARRSGRRRSDAPDQEGASTKPGQR